MALSTEKTHIKSKQMIKRSISANYLHMELTLNTIYYKFEGVSPKK